MAIIGTIYFTILGLVVLGGLTFLLGHSVEQVCKTYGFKSPIKKFLGLFLEKEE